MQEIISDTESVSSGYQRQFQSFVLQKLVSKDGKGRLNNVETCAENSRLEEDIHIDAMSHFYRIQMLETGDEKWS